MKKWIVILLIIGLAVSGIYYFRKKGDQITANQFEMIAVARGNVVREVTASGKIQPVNTVSVGTQVSGIIEKVLADYNDEVKKDQLLAQLDTSVLQENMNDAKAQLDLANSKKKIAKLNFDRFDKLYKDKLIAKANLEDAEIELATADANVLMAQAAYNKAAQNLGYAKIVSPVNGTIISREIEQGQTVAASFQTPTLFTIAEDLTKMQIEASIAEADIGMIVMGMPVTFTVDAYPQDKFQGSVEQIRLSPTIDQNVVMYTVVITADNTSRKLLPGMTAFVNIKIREAKDVLRIPTTALQFKPNAFVRQFVDKRTFELEPNQSIVYQFKGGMLVPVAFKRGLSDTSWVEVADGLNEGEKIVSEFIQKGRK